MLWIPPQGHFLRGADRVGNDFFSKLFNILNASLPDNHEASFGESDPERLNFYRLWAVY